MYFACLWEEWQSEKKLFSTQNLAVSSMAQVCAYLFPIWRWRGQMKTMKYKIGHSDTDVHSVSSVEVCCVFPLPASQAIHTGCGQPSLPFRSRSNQGPHLLCLLAWSEVQHPFFSFQFFVSFLFAYLTIEFMFYVFIGCLTSRRKSCCFSTAGLTSSNTFIEFDVDGNESTHKEFN